MNLVKNKIGKQTGNTKRLQKKTRSSNAVKNILTEFKQNMISEAIKLGLIYDVNYENTDNKIGFINGDKKCSMDVDNVYKAYKLLSGVPENIFLREFLKSITGAVDNAYIKSHYNDLKNNIFPILKRREIYCEGISDSRNNDFCRIYSDDASICLALTLNSSVVQIDKEILDSWGISFLDALLAANRPDIYQVSTVDHKVFTVSSSIPDSSGFGTAISIFEEIQTDGYPVFMIPTKDEILVAGSNDAVAISEIIAMSLERSKKSDLISSKIYKIENDKVVEFQPMDNTVNENLLHFKFKSMARDYAIQKKILERKIIESGEFLYVCEYVILQLIESGDIGTFCTWADGVHSLLPETDFVILAKDTENNGICTVETLPIRLDKLLSMGPDVIQKIDSFPVRYRVFSHPSEEMIQKADAEFPEL